MESSQEPSPVERMIGSAGAGIIRIGPNAVLSEQGLFVNGEKMELRHVDDFKAFVFATQSRICTVLESLFPNAIAAPDVNGNAQPSQFAGWELYAERVVLMQAGMDDVLEHGKALLQWCLAAQCAALLDDNPIRKSPEFLPIRLMIEQGGRALATSVGQWEAYVHWQAAFMTRLATGIGDERDPRPAPIAVVIPWPEALGLDFGGPARLFGNACRIATDIHVFMPDAPDSTFVAMLSIGRHSIRFDAEACAGLVDAYTEAAGESKATVVGITVGDQVFRAQGFPGPDQNEVASYCFRMIPKAG